MAVVVRTIRHHPIDVFQRRGFDVDDHFALARFWIREFLEARWFSKRTQYGSFHGHLIFFFPLIASRPEPRDGSGLTRIRLHLAIYFLPLPRAKRLKGCMLLRTLSRCLGPQASGTLRNESTTGQIWRGRGRGKALH